ncbi:hypothetical protein BDP27DRAFT_1310891 [Rhodocollybia butyracea]|uniref:Nephrocystin 3-like N-terminal domain-containing protein n=1 Tax=Rhodocollybia butyracea TaxID=206335 RepID=A0A9P5QAG2_9AGAR|nr:hypothetical protein BDP27DRAFT_1310891 [Rhodocollybia butyracea]
MSLFARAENFSVHDSSFVAGDNNTILIGDAQDAARTGLKLLYQSTVPEASYDAEQRYPPPNCHPGTRTRILELLRQWITDRSKITSIYWLYGPAGAGKSAIAQTICEEFSTCNGLAASFFFARTDPRRNNLRFFVLTIAYQIAKTLGPLVEGWIGTIIHHSPEILEATLIKQFQQLIIDPCRRLPSDSWLALPRLIVIDGLDECIDIISQERLLSILKQLKTSSNPLPIEFLICCRPEPRILHTFNDFDFHTVLDRIELCDNFESDSDIAHYLQDEFQRIRRDHGPAMAHVSQSWPGKDIIHQLVQRACGQFIYAKTVIKYVGDYYCLPTEQLDIILNITVPDTHESPYPDLDLLYLQILATSREKELLLDILVFVLRPREYTGLDRSASYSDIELFLFLPKGKLATLLFGLHSILEIPEDIHSPISIRHSSFEDFLVDPKRSDMYFVDINERITLCFLENVHRVINTQYPPIRVSLLRLGGLVCSRVKSPSEKLLSALERFRVDLRKLSDKSYSDNVLERYLFRGLDAIVQWTKDLSKSPKQEVNQVRLQVLAEEFGNILQEWVPVNSPISSAPSMIEWVDFGIAEMSGWPMIEQI